MKASSGMRNFEPSLSGKISCKFSPAVVLISVISRLVIFIFFMLSVLFLQSCSFKTDPVAGPDKQGSGMLAGGLLGGASGMITGAQIGAPAGPGAVIGAAFGAVWGSLSGFGLDLLEEEEIRLLMEVDRLQDDVWTQNSLISHLERKKELFPGRDIFPADEFFPADSVNLSYGGMLLAKAIAKRYAFQSSASRIQITSYHSSKLNRKDLTENSNEFARHIAKRRSQNLAKAFVSAGLEPRRFVLRSVALSLPLVDDPYDYEGRYANAVEFALVDR
ncbi:MAG TPA: glycine zipper family protein [Oligoflexia bacterium]|nr:glycine zipper family protein [Oligoflexia bacterium]HMP48418.1 glycine zipper family protein [Oligoflexia bacterium]